METTERQMTLEQAFEYGRACVQSGHILAAVDIFQRILEAFPKNEASSFQLALIKRTQGDHAAAEVLLSPLLTTYATNDVMLALYGDTLYRLDRFEEAEKYIRSALQINPGRWTAHVTLGHILARVKRCNEAVESYTIALEADSNNTDIAIDLIRLLTDELALDDACERLETLVAQQPDNLVYHYLLCASRAQRPQRNTSSPGSAADQPVTHKRQETLGANRPDHALHSLFASADHFRDGDVVAANAEITHAFEILYSLGANSEAILAKPSLADVAALKGYLSSDALFRDENTDFYQDEGYLNKIYSEYLRAITNFGPVSNDTTITQNHYLRRARKLLSDDASIDAVVNFGCFCAHSEHLLAKEFPNVQFIGIDRATLVKKLNEQHFKAVNVDFLADDILDWLDHSAPVKNGVLVHMRTAVYCLPKYLERLYQLARTKGYRHIVLLENVGFDRHTKTYPKFGDDFEPFILRNWILVHDYPTLLTRAGFTIEEKALVPLANVTINLRGDETTGCSQLRPGGWMIADMHLLCIHGVVTT